MMHTSPRTPTPDVRFGGIARLLVATLLTATLAVPPATAQEYDEPLWGRGGFVPVLSGLGESAGLTAGIRYDVFLRHPNYTLAADLIGSLRGYAGTRFAAGFENEEVAVFGFGRYRYMPKEMFYGFGESTDLDDAGDYRIDERLGGISLSLRPAGVLITGMHVSLLDNRFGAGRLGDVPPVAEIHEGIVGVGEDSRYAVLGVWVELDGRDHPRPQSMGYRYAPLAQSLRGLDLDVNRGWFVAAEAIPHISIGDGHPDFLRAEFEGQLFVPTSFTTDGFVLRSHLALTARGDDPVPFYLLPSLGGSNSIRGFRPDRFRDDHALLFNVEYRRAMLLFLDAAAFVDAGQTFSSADDLRLGGMEFGYGLGLRTRIGRFVLGRIDFARSREGIRVYLRAGTLF